MAQSSQSSWDKENISTLLQLTDSTSFSTKTSRERKLQFKNSTSLHLSEQELFLFSSGSVHLNSMQKESREVSSRYSSISWRTSICLMVHREACHKTSRMVVVQESKLVVLVKEDTSRTIEAEAVVSLAEENLSLGKEAVWTRDNLRECPSNSILNSLTKVCHNQWEWCRTHKWHQSKLLWWDNSSHKHSWI